MHGIGGESLLGRGIGEIARIDVLVEGTRRICRYSVAGAGSWDW